MKTHGKYEKLYKDYKLKCKELGIKPSPIDKVFGVELETSKSNNRERIAELAQQRKKKVENVANVAPELADKVSVPIKIDFKNTVKIPLKTETKVITVNPKKYEKQKKALKEYKNATT